MRWGPPLRGRSGPGLRAPVHPTLQVHIHPDTSHWRTAPRSDAWNSTAARKPGVARGAGHVPLHGRVRRRVQLRGSWSLLVQASLGPDLLT